MSFLDDAFTKAIDAKIRVSPQYTNRCSMAGVVCSRRLQWHRTKWSSAKPIDTGLARRFELGTVLEPIITRKLEDGGLTVLQRQRDMTWQQFSLTGHVDGLVTTPEGDEAVIDVKTCSSWVIEKLKKRIHTPAELLAEGGYIAGYVSQVALYALLLNKIRGFLFFVDKEALRTHTIEVRLDDEAVLNAAEAFLKRCVAVNAAIAAGVDLPPEPGPFCERCPFVAACMPDQTWASPTLLDDEEVEGWLERRAELKIMESELKEIDDGLKVRFREPGETIVGNWVVRVKETKTPSYTVKERTTLLRRYLPIEKQATVVATSTPKEETSVGSQDPEGGPVQEVQPEVPVDQPRSLGGPEAQG